MSVEFNHKDYPCRDCGTTKDVRLFPGATPDAKTMADRLVLCLKCERRRIVAHDGLVAACKAVFDEYKLHVSVSAFGDGADTEALLQGLGNALVAAEPEGGDDATGQQDCADPEAAGRGDDNDLAPATSG